MFNKRFGIGMLILAMLLVSITLVPASAKEEKTNANNSSDSEVETYGIEGLTPEKVKDLH
jgi:hypothetical protein